MVRALTVQLQDTGPVALAVLGPRPAALEGPDLHATTTVQAGPDASRRFVALMLDGFRADGAGPLPPPPTPRQVMRAMRRLSRPTGETRSTP